jgi:glucokinase
MGVRLGMDVGGTKANIGLFGDSGVMLCREKHSVPGGISARDLMRLLAVRVGEMIERRGVKRSDIVSAGMGVPGTTDGRAVLSAPNLHWVNEPCADYFAAEFGIAPIIAQDTRAAAWGEYCAGAGKGRRVLICVTLGTGIGSGIVINGRIYDGALGTAGEVGHIQVVPGGRPCNCGRHGCMEAYAAGPGILASAREHPALLSKVSVTRDVFDLALRNDAAAQEVIAGAVARCGQALCAMVNALSPDALIFSGGMSAQNALYVEPLMAHIRANAYALAVGDGLLMGVSSLGEDAPMTGAAMLNP